jgi:hypothetical protein
VVAAVDRRSMQIAWRTRKSGSESATTLKADEELKSPLFRRYREGFGLIPARYFRYAASLSGKTW